MYNIIMLSYYNNELYIIIISLDNNFCYYVLETLLDFRISSDSRKYCRHHDWPHHQYGKISHSHIHNSAKI